MTTANNDLTAMGLFRDQLDDDIKLKEKSLRANLERLKHEIDRTVAYLDGGHRVPREGVAVHRGMDIDRECAVLNTLYDTRMLMNDATAHHAKKDGAAS